MNYAMEVQLHLVHWLWWKQWCILVRSHHRLALRCQRKIRSLRIWDQLCSQPCETTHSKWYQWCNKVGLRSSTFTPVTHYCTGSNASQWVIYACFTHSFLLEAFLHCTNSKLYAVLAILTAHSLMHHDVFVTCIAEWAWANVMTGHTHTHRPRPFWNDYTEVLKWYVS